MSHHDPPPLAVCDAPVLLAMVIAARRLRDAELERVTRRELAERHGIRLVFARELAGRPSPGKGKEVARVD